MHRKKKNQSINPKSDKWYVRTSVTKESTADFDNPLELSTILEMSKKGMLKEKKIKPGKVA
jgi:hypothetical protein